MLPGGGFSSGFSDDVRGFRKKGKPGRVFQQYAPLLVVLLLVITIVVVVVLRSSAAHVSKQLSSKTQQLQTLSLENGNLLRNLQQERQSKANAEALVRESNTQLTNTRRELDNLRATSLQQENHCKSLQDSFDHTRLALEAERDAARLELNMANQRVVNLESSVSAKDKTLGEREHQNAAEHHAKDAEFANKEAEWEAMRKALEAQIRSQGGWVPQSPPPAGTAHPHHDYAAKTGSASFHPVQGGRRERFIDTAEDLEREGVSDPSGRSHLAKLLGHLYDLKVAEFTATLQSNPAAASQPRPAIGQWMAQTLEAMGITCKYGAVHMAYILDRHFSLEGNPTMVGRAGESTGSQADAGHSGGRTAKSATSVGGHDHQASAGTQHHATPPTLTPGIINSDGQGSERHAQEERRNMNAWRLRNQRHQKVDAAGFV